MLKIKYIVILLICVNFQNSKLYGMFGFGHVVQSNGVVKQTSYQTKNNSSFTIENIKIDQLTKNYLNSVNNQLQQKNINLSLEILYRTIILEDKSIVFSYDQEKEISIFRISNQARNGYCENTQ